MEDGNIETWFENKKTRHAPVRLSLTCCPHTHSHTHSLPHAHTHTLGWFYDQQLSFNTPVTPSLLPPNLQYFTLLAGILVHVVTLQGPLRVGGGRWGQLITLWFSRVQLWVTWQLQHNCVHNYPEGLDKAKGELRRMCIVYMFVGSLRVVYAVTGLIWIEQRSRLTPEAGRIATVVSS